MPATVFKDINHFELRKSPARKTLSNTATRLDNEYLFVHTNNILYLLYLKLEKEIKILKKTGSFTENEILNIKKKAIELSYKIVNFFSFEKMSIELTNEDSIVYTMIQDNFTCFLEVFYDDDESSELVLSIFENKKLVTSFTGNIENILSEISVHLS